jgi:hypothetical protein
MVRRLVLAVVFAATVLAPAAAQPGDTPSAMRHLEALLDRSPIW